MKYNIILSESLIGRKRNMRKSYVPSQQNSAVDCSPPKKRKPRREQKLPRCSSVFSRNRKLSARLKCVRFGLIFAFQMLFISASIEIVVIIGSVNVCLEF